MASETLAMLDGDYSYEWSDSARRLVIDSLASDDVEDRRLAAELATHVTDDETAVRELLRLLRSDSDDEVRSNAAIAMGPLLEEFDTAFDDDDVPVAVALVEELRRALRDVHDDATQPELVRRKALEAAVRSPDEWMAPAARKALGSTDPLWRMTGVFAAGHLGKMDSLVVGSLDDDDLRVRVEAVRAAAQGTVRGATVRILAWAGSEETERDLRLASIVALAHLPGESIGELLEELSADGDEEIAELAVMALDEHALWDEILADEK